MSYHILGYSADHDRRVPPDLRGALSCVSDQDRVLPNWSEAKGRFVVDGPLWYRSRETAIDLDFYPTHDGFLASDRLVDLLHHHAPDGLRLHPVEMVDGRGRPNAVRRMRFCQLRNRQPACDLALMDIDGAVHPELAGANQVQMWCGRTVIARAMELVLKPGLPAWFEATDIAPFGFLVSDRVRTDLVQADMLGVRCVDLKDVAIVDFMPGVADGYWLQQPQWRLREDLALWQRTNGRPDRNRFLDPAKPPADIAALIRGVAFDTATEGEK